MTPAEIKTASPCKFNLFLDVPSLRPDGYHEVVTVLEPLSFSDTLLFADRAEGTEVICDHPQVPSGPANIVFQAVELLRRLSKVQKGVRVIIKKNTFVAAGLGGGSANAAVTLRAVSRLWGLRLPPSSLLAPAQELGSDVPFFLRPRTSLGRGRGEMIEFLPPAPAFWSVLINPGFEISTRWAYQQLRVGPSARPVYPGLDRVLKALTASDLTALAGSMYNIFQKVLVRRVPCLGEILNFFRKEGALGAILSGSGPTVIGLAKAESAARRLAFQARSEFPQEYRIVVSSNQI